jgi:hypothetical protein
VDTQFWRSVYKLNGQSGGPVITGWITAFFPYLKDGRTGRAEHPVGELVTGGQSVDWYLSTERERLRGRNGYRATSATRPPGYGFVEGPTMQGLPGGLSKAPFRWELPGRDVDMEFLGGFMGVAQDHETLALRPEIGWAVREAPGPS